MNNPAFRRRAMVGVALAGLLTGAWAGQVLSTRSFLPTSKAEVRTTAAALGWPLAGNLGLPDLDSSCLSLQGPGPMGPTVGVHLVGVRPVAAEASCLLLISLDDEHEGAPDGLLDDLEVEPLVGGDA